MSTSASNRRFSYLRAIALVGALSAAAAAVPLGSAKAQGWVGFQFGPVGLGFGAPGYAYQYPYYPAYPYTYYYPRYYYPSYGYYYPY